MYTVKSNSNTSKFMAFGSSLCLNFTVIGEIPYNQHSCIILGVHGFPNFKKKKKTSLIFIS